MSSTPARRNDRKPLPTFDAWAGLERLEARTMLDGLSSHVTGVMIESNELHTGDGGIIYQFELEFTADTQVESARFQVPQVAMSANVLEEAWFDLVADLDGGGSEWFFEAESFDSADLAAFTDGTYILEVTFTGLGTLTTNVVFGSQETGEPLNAPTQVPVLLDPEIGGTDEEPTLTLGWNQSDQSAINTVGIEIEQDFGFDDGEFVIDEFVDAWAGNTYGPVSLPGGGFYDYEISFLNVSTGANTDGIATYVAKSISSQGFAEVGDPSSGGGLSDTLFDVFLGTLTEHHGEDTHKIFNFHFFTLDPSVISAQFQDVNGAWWDMMDDDMGEGVTRFTWTSWSGEGDTPPGYGQGTYVLELLYNDQTTQTTSFVITDTLSAPGSAPEVTSPTDGAQGVDVPTVFTFVPTADESVDGVALMIKNSDNGFGEVPQWGTDDEMSMFGEPLEFAEYANDPTVSELYADTLGPSQTYNYTVAFLSFEDQINDDGVFYTLGAGNGTTGAFSTLVAGAPDLIVDGEVMDLPEDVMAGATAEVEYTITNNGDATATGATNVRVYLSGDDTLDEFDTLVGSGNKTLSLAAGATTSGLINVALPAETEPGEYQFIVVVDEDDAVEEFNEDNNDMALDTFDVEESTIDLTGTLDGVTLAESVLAGAAGKATVTITNDGNTKAVGPIVVRFFASEDDVFDDGLDLQLGEVATSLSLLGGGTKTLTGNIVIPGDAPNGDYFILAVIDADGQIDELDEDNNVAVSATPVAVEEAFIDLSGEFLAVQMGESLLPGAKGKATLAVTNGGNVKATGQATIAIYASTDGEFGDGDVLLGSITNAAIGLNAGVTRNFNVNLLVPDDMPMDTYQLVAVIDSDDTMAEADEENNTAVGEVTFDVEEPNIDLSGVFGAISLGETLVPGDKGKAQVTLTNNGNVPASGPITIKLYASATGVVDGDAVEVGSYTGTLSLKPGTSKGFNINILLPGDLATGDYFLVADIDTHNALEESDEANNTAVSDSTYEVATQFGNVGDRANVKLTMQDGEGTPVTFTLKGAGTGTVSLTIDGEFDIELTGTDASTIVTVTTDGDAETIIHDVTADGAVKAIVAKTADLSGNITIAGSLGGLVLDDVADDHLIDIGGDGTGATAFVFDTVTDLSIASATPIKSLTATDWDDAGGDADSITAPWLGSLTIKGDAARELAGNFEADLTLDSTDVAKTLGKATVRGWWDGSESFIAGHVGTITVGGLRDSKIMVGTADAVTELPDGEDDFTELHAALGTLNVTGIAEESETVINSTIAAYALGKVTLRDVAEDNGGTAFGVAAHTIKSLNRIEEGVSYKYPGTWPENDIDFEVRVL